MVRQLRLICLVVLLCIPPALAQHSAEPFNNQSPQQDGSVPPVINGFAPNTLPPGGLDQWHAPPVPNGWGFPDLNVRVANFAVKHLTQKVGNGECWTLAKQALVSAGAQPPNGYVFGRELAQGQQWLPGDIIQFTNCHFVSAVPGGTSNVTIGSPNHTAIIYSVKNGTTVILQQNVNNDKRVQTEALNFSNMVSGTLKVYQPVFPQPGSNRGQKKYKFWFPSI